ncbi:hypothetical protein CEP51_003379 [Fusarium floridanum]|uniref:AAA+ ATPase domain-containing protein n=1 Tax=Fusarium floridanum TaxID=1325733 RepID=A0A428S6S9_9HYPO|nr:hypothetical protein CEP51_003379 [Fusarium floridanum]
MVRIHSTCLISVLRSLILYYPSLDLQKQEITISYPFKPFFYYWDDLQKILNGERTHETTATINMPDTGTKISIPCTTETYKHLNILLQAPPIQEVYRERVVPEIELHSRGLATFAQLWLLFKPGEIVFSRVRGELAGFVVQRITINSSKYSHDTPHPAARWKLVLWNLVYGNRKLRRQRHTVYINSFHGEKRISDMAAYPVKWAENQEELSAELIKRGKRYYDIICEEQSHMRYNGQVIAKKPYHYQGEIIVDHQSYKLEVSSSSSMEMLDISGEEPQDLRGEPLFSKFNDMECSPGNRLQRAQYLLLPAYVLGFALGKREWAIFDMSFVEPLEVDKNDPMKNVIIDRSKRNLIEAAAGFRRKKHGVEPWDTDWTADFVEGKGRGRVVFLHGPPGTGKTMTVECIAKKTNRPLMRISAADLGMKEVEMEGRLVKWLDRATRWGAVMLIDEAEVYLEQRKTGNINQNALVTAFLRTMEYFPGLLFLTSNSIGLFDEAVMSRIHLAIRYDRPTDAQRKMIWTSLFKKLDKDQPSENSGKDDASTSKTTVLLGAISMAVFQAQRDGKCPDVVEVTKEHLKEVLKNKEEFNEDYKHATGFYPDERAAEDFRRPGGDADKDE